MLILALMGFAPDIPSGSVAGCGFVWPPGVTRFGDPGAFSSRLGSPQCPSSFLAFKKFCSNWSADGQADLSSNAFTPASSGV